MAVKHKAEIVIDAERAAVWKLFDDPEKIKRMTFFMRSSILRRTEDDLKRFKLLVESSAARETL